jgi:hypothetical protein
VRPWSTSPTWTWGGYVGTFEIKASVRSAGHASADAARTVTMQWVAWPPVTFDGIVTDKASGQLAGTNVMFTAPASGGLAPLEYEFQYRDTSGNNWILVKPWSTSSTWTWGGYAGTFEIKVMVRSTGHASVDATRTVLVEWVQ